MFRLVSIYGALCLAAMSLACTPQSTMGGDEVMGGFAFGFSTENEAWHVAGISIWNDTTHLKRVAGVVVYRDVKQPNSPEFSLSFRGSTHPVEVDFGTKTSFKLPQGTIVILGDEGDVLRKKTGVDFQATDSEFKGELKIILLKMFAEWEDSKKDTTAVR